MRFSTTPRSSDGSTTASSVPGTSSDLGFGFSRFNPQPLIGIQTGIVPPPTSAPAVEKQGPMNGAQATAAPGSVVPVVFCLRDGNFGGVMVAPKATEARFENDAQNRVTASYVLVVSEGLIGPIAVKDVFSGGCRHGSHTQTYNRRAGTWLPGNAIVQRTGYTLPQCPTVCGSIGAYTGITTVSFSRQVPNGSTLWNRQVQLFIRAGIQVQRLVGGGFGSSNNFADFTYWLLSKIGNLPANMIDIEALRDVALFLNANQLRCDCELKEQINFEELITKWAPFFLVRLRRRNGMRGLIPLVPTLQDGTINTSAAVAVYEFDESTVIPGSFQIEYAPLEKRKPFKVQVIWRQQLQDDASSPRTITVSYTNVDQATLSVETHDLSQFCTSQAHAAKFAAYHLASRMHKEHSISFSARPQAHNIQVNIGDIVRVNLQRRTVGAITQNHDFLYEVISRNKTLEGLVSYECIHHPIDTLGRSIVAMAVSNINISEPQVPVTRSGLTCDENAGRATDNTVPAEQYIQIINPPTPLAPEVEDAIVEPVELLIGNMPAQGTPGSIVNPDDGLDS